MCEAGGWFACAGSTVRMMSERGAQDALPYRADLNLLDKVRSLHTISVPRRQGLAAQTCSH